MAAPSRLFAGILIFALGPFPAFADEVPLQVQEDERCLRARGIDGDGLGLLAFFRGETLSAEEAKQACDLLAQLGSPCYRARELATAKILRGGPRLLGFLRRACAAADLEVRRRAAQCLRKLEHRSRSEEACAAARLLRHRRPAGTASVLLDYLPSAPDQFVVDEINDTLFQLDSCSPVEGTRPASPTARARAIARQFLEAMSEGHYVTFRRQVEVPFTLPGNVTLRTEEEFDQLFRQVVAEKAALPRTEYTILYVAGYNDFVRTAAGAGQSWHCAYPPHEMRAVFVRGRFGQEREEQAVLFVRLQGGAGRVVGIGQFGDVVYDSGEPQATSTAR